ncbi:MAG TPA: ABC transporter ATP-binding protein [Candidatus Polarisedimenticolaceae bacterium]|nr:ABC transporter ATP-binding protein [Candidatus Polarisedimenticolaceae bacterium]
MDYAIEGFQLEKSFAKKRALAEILRRPFGAAEQVAALRGVDLHVKEGEIFGLLGPNGAGKTTLVKILSCLILPDRGRAVIAGTDVRQENKVKPKLGFVHSDERSFYWRLSGRENMRFFARLYDVPGKAMEARIDELLRKVDLVEAADRRFSGYSSGMKQRLAIARALLHDPPILLMDEPTRSLDPASSLSLRAFIKDELKGRDRKTILLATHNLREAEALCDRIAILVQGTVRQTGTIAEVRRWGIDERRFKIDISAVPLESVRGPFKIVSDERVNGSVRLVVALDGDGRLSDVLHALMAAGAVVHSCDRIEPDLEEAFARLLESEKAKG